MDFIYEVENFLSPEMCQMVIDCFEKSVNKHRPGIVGLGQIRPHIKKSTDLGMSEFDTCTYGKKLETELLSLCFKHISKYFQNILENYDYPNNTENFLNNLKMSGLQVQRTDPGGYFKWHEDSFKGRVLSLIIYLNDLDENDGGETEFSCGKVIKPTQGKLLLFPSTWTYLHRGKRLLKNKKYIATSFLGYFTDDKSNKV